MDGQVKKCLIIGILFVILTVSVSGILGGEALVGKAIQIAGSMAILGYVYILLSKMFDLVANFFIFNDAAGFANLWNPTVSGTDADPATRSIVNSFILILQPFYVTAIVLTGVYLLFVSGSPAGRAKAKSTFWKLILSMVLVNLSMPVFQVLLNISAALAAAVKITGDSVLEGGLSISSVTTPFTALVISLAAVFVPITELAVVIIAIWAILPSILLIFLIELRRLILLVLAMLFPFTIFLHFLELPFTRTISAKLVRLTFIWAFLPVIMILAVIGAQIAIKSYTDECPAGNLVSIPGIGALATLFSSILGNQNCFMAVLMSLVGTFLIILTPFMMSGIATWIGTGIAAFGMMSWDKPWGWTLTSAGGMLAGMGPGALMMGGQQEMLRKASPGPKPTEEPPVPSQPPVPVPKEKRKYRRTKPRKAWFRDEPGFVDSYK